METASPGATQESRKTNHAPFREVEGLKENSLHQLVGGAERLKNLYLGLVRVHLRISALRDERIKLVLNGSGNHTSRRGGRVSVKRRRVRGVHEQLAAARIAFHGRDAALRRPRTAIHVANRPADGAARRPYHGIPRS